MSEPERIHKKYIAAASRLDPTWIDLNVFSFGLRLALQELADSVHPTALEPQSDEWLSHVMRLTEYIDAAHCMVMPESAVDRAIELLRQSAPKIISADKLTMWLEGNGYGDSDSYGADTAIELIESQREEISRMNARIVELSDLMSRMSDASKLDSREIVNLREQITQIDADSARLIAERNALAQRHTNGTLRTDVAEPTVAATTTGYPTPILTAEEADWQMWHAKMLTTLSPEVRDYWDGIAAGRWTWRRLPKAVRLAMVRHVLSFGPEEGDMTQSSFDAIKPEWMPAAAVHPVTFGVSWAALNDLRTEIEVR